jgi:hypothetical protein
MLMLSSSLINLSSIQGTVLVHSLQCRPSCRLCGLALVCATKSSTSQSLCSHLDARRIFQESKAKILHKFDEAVTLAIVAVVIAVAVAVAVAVAIHQRRLVLLSSILSSLLVVSFCQAQGSFLAETKRYSCTRPRRGSSLDRSIADSEESRSSQVYSSS